MQGVKTKWQTSRVDHSVKDCIASGNHHLLDPGIDGGKWLKAKEDREHESNLTDHKSVVPDPPQKNWRVFPSYNIPSKTRIEKFINQFILAKSFYDHDSNSPVGI